MVELVDLEGVENQIYEVLINVIHLNDEVSLIDGLVLRIFGNFIEDASFLQVTQLLSHIVWPQAKVVDDLLSDYILRIVVIILLIDKVDLLHHLSFSFAHNRTDHALDIVGGDNRELRALAERWGWTTAFHADNTLDDGQTSVRLEELIIWVVLRKMVEAVSKILQVILDFLSFIILFI